MVGIGVLCPKSIESNPWCLGGCCVVSSFLLVDGRVDFLSLIHGENGPPGGLFSAVSSFVSDEEMDRLGFIHGENKLVFGLGSEVSSFESSGVLGSLGCEPSKNAFDKEKNNELLI